jgi:hypothetical protein
MPRFNRQFCLPNLSSSVTSSNATLHNFTILYGRMYMPRSFSTTSSSLSSSRQSVQQSTRCLQISDTFISQYKSHCVYDLYLTLAQTTGMRRITTFRSTTDCIYDDGPVK